MANVRVGRPKGAAPAALKMVTIMTSDDLIKRRYPHAFVGLIRARQTAGLSQETLGEVLGITQCQYGRLEKGLSVLSLLDAKALADHFGLTLEELF